MDENIDKSIEIKRSYRSYLILFWSLFVVAVTVPICLFFVIEKGSLGEIPTLEELENPPNIYASEVYSEDGVVLRKFFIDNRTIVKYEDISPNVINALISTEDVRFYDHPGIDLRGLARVAKGVITGDSSAGGGSTLSQQLAKMTFPRERFSSPVDLVTRKFKEWIIAVKLERNFTKEEILSMYLTKYDFLNLAVGIKSAANIYFSTTPDSLKIHEAAMLVGMAKNSSLYNPLSRPELTKSRRDVVFSQMNKYGYISTSELDSLKRLPLGLRYNKEDFKGGVGTYLTEYLRTIMNAKKPDKSRYGSWQFQKYIEDSVEWQTNPLYGWCNKNLKANGEPYNLYRDGVKIYSTLNSKMQRYAEESLVQHLSKDLQPKFDRLMKRLKNPPFTDDLGPKAVGSLVDMKIKQTERYRLMKKRGKSMDQIRAKFDEKVKMKIFSWRGEIDTIMSPTDSLKYYLSFLRSAMMTYDPSSGHVKAYVGGPNYRYFMFDMVKGGKRQVGSTVKPFLYTLAMQNGFSPCTEALNVEYTFNLPDGTTWSPQNSGDDRYGEVVTLEWGLANSVNNISAWLMQMFGDGGPSAMAKIMKKMGITSKIDVVPSMFLGTTEISVYEMVGAFGTFVNNGIHTKPIFVSRIEDKFGNVLAQFTPDRSEAIDENSAYLMTSLLKGVVDGGTGGRLRWNDKYGGLTASIGGKTGTTQNHSDGWFMGITPELVTGVWTGADLRSIRFNSISFGQGANMALPIYGYYMNKVYADKELGYSQDTEFKRPDGFDIDLGCGESKDGEDNQSSDSFDDDEFF